MNTSSRTPPLAALLAAAFLAAALAACDNEFGIISSIQAEKEQTGTKLFLNTTVTKALAFNGSIYASSSRLYSRPASGGAWAAVPVASRSDYAILSIAASATKLYAAVLDSSGTGKVFGYDGASWTEVGLPTDIAAPDTFLVDALFSAGTEIYAQAHVTDPDGASRYTLYRLSSGALSAAVAGMVGIDSPVAGVAERVPGEFWYVARGTSSTAALSAKVMTGTNAAASTDHATTGLVPLGLAAGTKINRIAVGGTVLYLGATDGALYAYGGTAWSSGKPGGDDGIPLGAIALVSDGGADRLLVGTDTVSSTEAADGYYEGSSGGSVLGWSFASGSDGAFAQSSSVYSTTITGKPVLGFLHDAANGTLYACLAPGASGGIYGLYSTKLESGAWTGWRAE